MCVIPVLVFWLAGSNAEYFYLFIFIYLFFYFFLLLFFFLFEGVESNVFGSKRLAKESCRLSCRLPTAHTLSASGMLLPFGRQTNGAFSLRLFADSPPRVSLGLNSCPAKGPLDLLKSLRLPKGVGPRWHHRA